jgi:hypothetical protein
MELISKSTAQEQGLKTYFDGKHCRKGHLSPRYVSTGICVECSKVRDRTQTESEAEQARLRTKEWREKNLERARRKSREYHRAVREQRKPYILQWREENRDRLRERARERRKDPKRKLAHSISNLIRLSLSNNGYSKRTKTYQILGCTFDEFKRHIERQFLKGMTWENRGDWHLDHITPIASANSEEEILALNHYTNLRPFWAKDNIAKSDKILFLI